MEYAKTKKIVWDGEEVPVVDIDAMRLIAEGICIAARCGCTPVFVIRYTEGGPGLEGATGIEDVHEMLSDVNLRQYEIDDYLVLYLNGRPLVACDAWM